MSLRFHFCYCLYSFRCLVCSLMPALSLGSAAYSPCSEINEREPRDLGTWKCKTYFCVKRWKYRLDVLIWHKRKIIKKTRLQRGGKPRWTELGPIAPVCSLKLDFIILR